MGTQKNSNTKPTNETKYTDFEPFSNAIEIHFPSAYHNGKYQKSRFISTTFSHPLLYPVFMLY
jgi:hypothetical protein